MISNGNSFGSGAVPVRDGGEGGEGPGNSWLFRVPGTHKLGNAR